MEKWHCVFVSAKIFSKFLLMDLFDFAPTSTLFHSFTHLEKVSVAICGRYISGNLFMSLSMTTHRTVRKQERGSLSQIAVKILVDYHHILYVLYTFPKNAPKT